MRAFVVRGFGLKAGVNFDSVDDQLIAPALRMAKLEGGTTGLIVAGGNVREDVFRELIMADVVIADISIHNANVFYELGIRHAVRQRATVLIRARIDEVPFDLKTDRYLSYDPADPAAAIPQLVQVLEQTLADERVDSPVFQLLPRFTAGDRTALLEVPRDLSEDIGQARENKWVGDLRLIAEEVVGLRFEEAALRAVAKASADVGDDVGAKNAWERIRSLHPDDFQANRALSDSYRRLNDLVASDQAIDRALGGHAPASQDRAELYALRGSNSKRRWAERWRREDDAAARARVALRSGELQSALASYRRGFEADLNHWYSGLNALALAKITLQLADGNLPTWRSRFDSDEDADNELHTLRSELAWLTSTVRASLNTARSRSLREGIADPWLEISFADLRFLTSDDPERVSAAYEAAMSSAQSQGTIRSIRDQLELYRDLGVLVDNAKAALAMLPSTAAEEVARISPLVFSGHMIDAADRPHSRFPPDKEDVARAAIRKAIEKFKAGLNGDESVRVVGMAGASDGGDLLFHEACHELGIKTHVLLPVPERVYRATALSRQASRWANRYYAVLGRAEQVRMLSRTDGLPRWLTTKPDYGTWRRNNRWILSHAWATTTTDRVTLLALWNGQVGDGTGGVDNMVATAQQFYVDVLTLDTVKLFGWPEATGDEPRAGARADSASEIVPTDPAARPLQPPLEPTAVD